MNKLAIITTHPIQYNAPLFALIAKEPSIELMVFYTWGKASIGAKYDPDFGSIIKWDIPLLEGYEYRFVVNTSKVPGSHHFRGIINPTLNQEIEKWGADIVWVWGWSFNSHLKALRYFKGKIPVWFRGDSTLLDEPKGFSLKKMARRVFLTWVYKHVDKVFYVGTHNKAYYKKHNLKESQLVYAPHAIDNERFSDPTGDKSNEVLKWREKLGIKKEDFVLLFAGKFEPRKNPMFLVELMQEFQSESIKLLLVGNGPLEKKLKSKFAKDDRVIFLDFQNQSDMPLIYRTSQLFILPSISETWGLALNEAMACGIPVLASAKCGAAIDIVDASSGLVFEPNDIEKVAGYIQDLENNLVIYTNLCLGAMAKSNQFKYSNIITAVKNVLKPSGSENNTFS